MATITLKLDTRSTKKNRTHPVKLYVSHGKIEFFISTGISVAADQWTGNESAPTGVRLYDTPLLQMITSARAKLYALRADGKLDNIDKSTLQAELSAFLGEVKKPITEKAKPLVKDVFVQFTELSVKPKTRYIYKQTLIRIGKHSDINSLTFEEINIPWLRNIENIMRGDGLSVNTISVHLRQLRAVFNRAIDDDIIDQNLYPFRKFKIKSERTIKRSLTVEQLRALRDYKCEPHQERYRDMFMLMFYMIGINAVDLFNLKELANGRAEFRRSKTSRLYSIKIEPEALAIIERHKGKDYLLNVLDTYGDYSDFLRRINRGLQSIGTFEKVANNAKDPKNIKFNKKEITAQFPGITTYWARHTWATIAASLDVPKETIAAALGHGGNSVTDIYIDFDKRKVDLANRKVIDYVNGE